VQDVACLDLRGSFELAFIAFNSFAELITEKDQRSALERIFGVLARGGRVVCTLHNPAVRLRSIGQGPTTLARFPLDSGDGRVILTADLDYDSQTRQVSGVQTVRQVDRGGKTVGEHVLPICFALIEPTTFEQMSTQAGFKLDALHGDYRRSAFDAQDSPYMIWALGKPD